MRETYGWDRHLGWLVVLLTVLMLGGADAAAAEPKKFTLINVVLDGTKIWLPSSLIVHQGEEVELTLINILAMLEEQREFNRQQVRINADVSVTLARLETLMTEVFRERHNGRDT